MKFVFATLAAVFVSGPAGAAPRLSIASAMPEAEIVHLKREIADARRAHPEWFAGLAAIRGFTPEGYAMNRNPVPVVHPELRALGKNAVLPIVEALAFKAPDAWATVSARDEAALNEGLIDVLGEFRDQRAVPVLRAIWQGAPASMAASKAAARGLGRQCSEQNAQLLASGLGTDRESAAVSGLGQCRTVIGAQVLARAIADARGRTLEERARAAGQAGSSWAWRAKGASLAAEGEQVRATLSNALVAAWGRADTERPAIEKALMMNAHASGVAALERLAADRPALAVAARKVASALAQRK